MIVFVSGPWYGTTVIVRFVGNFDKTCRLARSLSESAADQAFSANDLADRIGQSAYCLLEELRDLERKDWIYRVDDDWTAPETVDTRWWVREHQSLTRDKHYEVLACEMDSYRILDDKDDPVLFDKSLFYTTDATVPTFWHREIDSDGGVWWGPKNWTLQGYFEQFHDGNAEVIRDFWRSLADLYPKTSAQRATAH